MLVILWYKQYKVYIKEKIIIIIQTILHTHELHLFIILVDKKDTQEIQETYTKEMWKVQTRHHDRKPLDANKPLNFY